MRRVRLALFVAAAVALAYALAIAVAYQHPPVFVRSHSELTFQGERAMVADLTVNAPVAIRLTGVAVLGGADPDTAEAVVHEDGPSNIITHGEPVPWQKIGPVRGWKVPPSGGRYPDSHGIKLTWANETLAPDTVIIKYRYLGWPFQTSIHPIAWPAVPAAAAPADQSALRRACVSAEPPGSDLMQAVLDEVTAAVKENWGDAPALQNRLLQLGGEQPMPMAVRADADGDGAPDMLVAFGFCGTPVLVYRAADPGRQVLLPVENDANMMTGSGSRIDRVADVNGDGVPEVVAAGIVVGGSAEHTWVSVWRWDQGFQRLWRAHVSNWRGPNQLTVGDGTASIQCRPIGPFEHKLTPSRQQTELFRWNAATRQYELTGRTREPAEYQSSQVSLAEELFQAGDYAGALAAFQEVPRFRPPAQPEADWPAVAALRIGQIHALAGRQTEALRVLEQAAGGASHVGPLAVAFRDAYQTGNVADGFQAAWEYIKRHSDDADWPFLLERRTLGARRAMLDAYKTVGQAPPADLPEAVEFPAPDCLTLGY